MPEKCVIIGDYAFPLRTNLLKPYRKTGLNNSEIIFNYRLSRARRVVENLFGILVWWFRIFSKPIDLKSKTIDKAVDREDLNNGNIISGEWREHVNSLDSVSQIGSNNYKRAAEEVRNLLAKYFMEVNPLPWQWEKVGITI
ncbi:uncharacterized protein LOC103311814 [Acyrthosiphon pisum]|uniref:DDE Tnp4 domain-containing protein n=1 Tax=Acyrthosiphon pisum TaxID=7029 RepID=A0A8R2FFA6_ACYPI|nr:uncharacterized protein LOC103311814 [Acyrthosiphon pisum]|eukprot:XP_008189766.1 PREDICTED: uncharacterized protein LOC103311814 [Acyrthosiphon pisum]